MPARAGATAGGVSVAVRRVVDRVQGVGVAAAVEGGGAAVVSPEYNARGAAAGDGWSVI